MSSSLPHRKSPLASLVTALVMLAALLVLTVKVVHVVRPHGHSVSKKEALLMGMTLENDARQPQKDGLVVTSIESGGPAAKAGLFVGDHITAVDGRPTHDTAHLRTYLHTRQRHVRLQLVRGKTRRNIDLNFASSPTHKGVVRHGA